MPGLIARYRDYLPVAEEFIVTLLEGSTPLLAAPRLASQICPGVELYLKFEGLNPTGSFKDRGMTYAVSKAREQGARAILCASTGNTSASAAAYAARAGLEAVVLIPQGQIALGKLSQAIMHGAKVCQIEGGFDAALAVVRQLGQHYNMEIVNSINPYRLLGQRTAAFEIVDALGKAPHYHFLPVGNAGNITAYWQGYKEYQGLGKVLPRMMGFQAAGAAPIVDGKPVPEPKTVASAIRIGNPASWQGALQARDESGGRIDKVTDEEILVAYRLVARCEGYFCEPASATSIAGVIKCAQAGLFKKSDVVVGTLTGHGLKDPDTAMAQAPTLPQAKPDLDSVAKVLGL